MILTAVAACLNSALYTASRMLFSLGERSDAPQAVRNLTGMGCRGVAVLASMVVGFLAVIGNYLSPEKIFAYLLATGGAVALFVYLAIAVSQLVLGRNMRSAGERAPVKMWLFPYPTIVVIATIVAILVLMAFDSDEQQAIFLSTISAAFHRGRRRVRAPTPQPRILNGPLTLKRQSARHLFPYGGDPAGSSHPFAHICSGRRRPLSMTCR
ncbi:MAG: gabP [Mycobacterium sp.]|nr:gabP [Mycobacterium sp.]